MQTQTTQLLVIGGGTGGYVAAIRASQLGIKTILVEGDRIGGTCLNIGCIPSKALIHVADEFEKANHYAATSPLGIRVQKPALDIEQAVQWKDDVVQRLTQGVASLLKKAGAQVVAGRATLVDGKTVDVGDLRISCEHLLLATGSEPTALPSLPFGGRVISSTEALSPTSIPKRLIVVGAGYIGLELGIAYRKLGADVTVIEALARVLSQYDAELTKPVEASLKKLGIALHLNCKVLGVKGNGVQMQDAQGAPHVVAADRVLVAVGRRPRTQGFGLEKLLLDMNGPFVKVDDQCRTSMRNVWAVGDLTGEPMLAHRAIAQGELVAEIIAGHRRRFAPASIPAIVFTDPEVVVSGLSPDEAKAAGVDCIQSHFPFAGNGRSLTLESREGFVRVVARRDNHLIVGWQAVGKGVSELAAAFSQSLEMGARLEDVAGTIHAHPTLGEAVQEAALRALGHAIHV